MAAADSTPSRSVLHNSASRRTFFRTAGYAGGLLLAPGFLAACARGETAATPSTSAAAAGGGSSAAPATGNLVIGEVHATTGPAASTYRNYFIPANIAVEELNAAGGIAGRQLTENLKDDGADPAKETQVFRQFADEGVNLVIGPNTSTTCLAAVPLATQSKILNLNVATSDILNDVGTYPYTFLIGPTNTPAMNTIVDFAAAKGWKKLALLHSNDTFGQQSVDPITARCAEKGIELVTVVEHPVDATEMTPYVARVQEAGPDAVVCILALVATQTAMYNAFQNLDFDVPKLGTTSMSSETLRAAIPAEAYANTFAVYLKSFSYTDTEEVSAKSLAYVENVTAQAGNFNGLTTAGLVYGPYDFLHMLKAAIETAGSSETEAVVAALEAMEPYDGVIGTIKFTAESHNGLEDGSLVMCDAASGGDADKSKGGFLLKRG